MNAADVRLDPAVFYRLRWMQAESEAAGLRADVASLRFREALMRAGADPDIAYAWRNADTTLVAPTGPQEIVS